MLVTERKDRTVIFDIIHLVATLDFAKSKQDFTG